MNVLVATDGSKYGRWGLNWVAKLPFVERPSVTALQRRVICIRPTDGFRFVQIYLGCQHDFLELSQRRNDTIHV